jgi:hypothetical protein
MRNFGLTLKEYQAKMASQQGVCAVCHLSSAKRLAVDHCHTTKQTRDLLCHRCNLALGLLEDSETLALALASYLNKWS